MLIFNDAAIRLSIGTHVVGSGTTYGSPTSIEGIATKVSIRESVDKIKTKAMADARKKFRVNGGETTIDIDELVSVTGLSNYSSGTLLGKPIKFEMKELSSFSTYKVWTGVITAWEWGGSDGEAQVEKITIDCDYDGA